MFPRNGHRPQHSHPLIGSETTVSQGPPYGWSLRHMGPRPLNYPPQPVEIDPVSYPRTPGTFSPWEPANYSIGSVGEPSPSLSSSIVHNRTASMSLDLGARSGPQDALAGWYSANDAPWVPKGVVPEVSSEDRLYGRGYRPHRLSGYGLQPGARHRPENASENGSGQFGVPPSDSGYGTGLSLESASVRGSDIVDHSQDNRSQLGRVPEYRQYNESGSLRDAGDQWPFAAPSAPSYRCETCKKPVKTKSELKKHHLRHTKPFSCSNPNCTRTEGFSTVNDLERHIRMAGCKSQEKIWPRLDNFKSHLKRMHRLQEDDMEIYVQRGGGKRNLSQGTSSESPSRLDQDASLDLDPVDFPNLAHHDDYPQWSHVSPRSLDRHPELTEPLLENTDPQTLAPPKGESPVNQEDDPEKQLNFEGSRASWEPEATTGCLEDRKLDDPSSNSASELTAAPMIDLPGSTAGKLESPGVCERGKTRQKKIPAIDPGLRDLLAAVLFTANLGKNANSNTGSKSLPGIGLPDAACRSEISTCRMDPGIALPSPAMTSGGRPDDQNPCLDTSAASGSDKKDLTEQLLQAIRDAGYIVKKDSKSPAGHAHTLNNLGSGVSRKRDLVSCDEAKCRFRGRPCELKKHMKRHTRPYGCTFSNCTKTFGSKNDWKRHEVSQHYQHETWRCDEKTNGAACAKVFFSVETARSHLAKVHNVTDPDTLERKIDARRIGENLQTRFWCGFCEKIMDLNQKGIDGWNERFNHVDAHFMGKNSLTKQQIAEWKAADSEGVFQQQASPKPGSPDDADQETSDDSSPSSMDTSLPTQAMSGIPTTIAEAGLATQKRKLTSSDEREERAPKHSRHGTYEVEIRIECCQCFFILNPKTDTSCPMDSHNICNRCQKVRVGAPKDTAP